MATPLNFSDEVILLVQDVLACRVEDFPCCYLGIPLSVYRLRRSDQQPLIDKVAARIIGWKGQLLNAVGQTTWSMLQCHPFLSIHPFLYAYHLGRSESLTSCTARSFGKIITRCKVTCIPKELSGLGILDLRRTGVAMSVPWVYKDRHNRMTRPRTKGACCLGSVQSSYCVHPWQ